MDDFDQELLNIIRDEHPENLEEAVKIARLRFPKNEETVMDRVLRLESGGKISFEKPISNVSSSLSEYFWSSLARWFWVVAILAVVTSITVFLVPEDSFPLVYVRYITGSVFVLYLPGYSLIKALFNKKELDDIERFALSVGLSLALVPLVGLLLNYTPWGIRTIPVTLSLLVLTLVFSSAALVRDYGAQKKLMI